MNVSQIMVNLGGLAIIAWIIWYFWLLRGESVAAQIRGGGVQEGTCR